MKQVFLGYTLADLNAFFLCLLVFIVCLGFTLARFFSSRWPIGILSLIAAASCVGAALTTRFPWYHTNALGLLAGAIILSAFGIVLIKRASQKPEDLFESLSASLPLTDVLYTPSMGFSKKCCWYCGKPHAEVRPVRLLRYIFLLVFATSQSLTLEIPLCAEHGDNSQYIWTFGKKVFRLRTYDDEKNYAIIRFQDEKLAQTIRDDLMIQT